MSYRSYNDTSSYRPRSGTSVGVTLARNASSGSTALSNYRTSYSGNSASVSRALGSGKERITGVPSSGYGNVGLNKRDKSNDDKSYKFSVQKTEKNRLNPGRSSTEDLHKSPISEKTIYEKYTYPATKTTDRQTSVADKYNRSIVSRDKSRETDVTSRYVSSTYPATNIRCNYDVKSAEKKERSENSSYKSVRNSGTCRSSREPSPEVGSKSFRVYPRVSNYGRSGNSNEAAPIAPRYSSSSRYGSLSRNVERPTLPSSYTNAERLRSSTVKGSSTVKEGCKSLQPKEPPETAVKTLEVSPQKESGSQETPEEPDTETITLTVVSRGTSPGPPASSSFVRNRRAEAARLIQKQITKLKTKSETRDAEMQSEKDDSSSRYSRFSSGRVWTSYLDKFQPSGYSRNYGSRISNYYGRQANDQKVDQHHEPIGESEKVEKLQAINTQTLEAVVKTEAVIETEAVVKTEVAKKKQENSLKLPRSYQKSQPIDNDFKDDSPNELREEMLMKRHDSSVSSVSSESSPKVSRNNSQKSLNQSQLMTRAESSDSVSLPTGRTKTSSTSHQIKIKSTSSQSSSSGKTNSVRTSGSETRGKPPVPKMGEVGGIMKVGSSKCVNKDFRKSVLNMDTGEVKKISYKRGKKVQRSVSMSSQDSESSERNEEKGLVQKLRRRKNLTSESSDESSSSSEDERSEGKRDRRNLPTKRGVSGESRTSVLCSSADELSVNSEKPPRPPSSPRSKSTKSEEAKSFLIRKLAPVANYFRSNEEVEDSVDSRRLSRSPSVNKSIGLSNRGHSERNFDSMEQNTLRHQSSGERPWWMDANSDNVPEGVERMSVCQDEISQETTVSTNLPDDGKFKTHLWRQDSGERPWWLDTDDNKKDMSASSRKTSSHGSSEHKNRLIHQQSGERAWWLSEDPTDVPEGIEVYPPVAIVSPISFTNASGDNSVSLVEDETHTRSQNRISHVDSGERAWWMDSNSNIPDCIQKLTPDGDANNHSNSDDTDESFVKFEIVQEHSQCHAGRILSRFPIEFPPPPPTDEPLGDRASPEGISSSQRENSRRSPKLSSIGSENPPDPPDCYEGRGSPYDNVQSLGRSTPRKSYRKRPSTLPLFIGNHTNIDDLLGEVAPRHSPIMFRIRNQETMEDDSDGSLECEEIDADQVIIHDSTPKTPVIQRRGRDPERPQPDGYIPIGLKSLRSVH